MSKLQRVLIYGGKTALGSKCVTHFKANGWSVGSIDKEANEEADFNVLVISANTLQQQEEQILHELVLELRDEKVDAILCVAEEWLPGNAQQELGKVTDTLWKQNVWPSVIAASIAAVYLKEDGFLGLKGDSVALAETPDMIGYGLSKTAVHHLTKSIAGNNGGINVEWGNGFPSKAIVAAILPTIPETHQKSSSTTPLEFMVELLWKWCNKEERPPNGTLLQMFTKDCITDTVSSPKYKIHITRRKITLNSSDGNTNSS